MSAPVLHRSACPACAAANAPVIIPRIDFEDPVFQAYFRAFYSAEVAACLKQLRLPPAELRSCGACGTIFHGVVPSPEALLDFYSSLQVSTFRTEEPLQTYREEQRLLELMMIVRFLQGGAPRPSVLDFGTGDGSWARLAAATGCRVAATDTAQDAFASLEAAGITCFHPDRLPSSAFDFINTEQVFEHLPNPAATLVRLVAALRPGGVLKIGVPHDPRLREKLAAPDWSAPKNSPSSLNSVAPVEHLNAFTPEGLSRLGRRADLLLLDISGWSLIDPRSVPPSSFRATFVRRLRDRLGQRHRPAYTLAQTRFFLLPT